MPLGEDLELQVHDHRGSAVSKGTLAATCDLLQWVVDKRERGTACERPPSSAPASPLLAASTAVSAASHISPAEATMAPGR